MMIQIAAGLLSLAAAQAAVIHSFTGTSAPNTQGWSTPGGVTSGAAVTDLGQSAWQMTGNDCCGYWFQGLSSAQWTDAFDRGWSLSGTVRTTGTAGTGYLVLDVPGGGSLNRFDLSFGNDGANGWAGLSSFFDAANPALKTTFTDNDYHLLDMRYDPLTGSASLWVDGLLVLSGYTGHTQFREGHGPLFGASGFTTQVFLQNVVFSINDPASPGGGGTGGSSGDPSGVPEPSTYALLLAGVALIAGAGKLRTVR